MTAFVQDVLEFLSAAAPWWGVAAAAFALSLAFTPLCRALAKAAGMVDMPSGRRINKKPTPRAGGVAVYLATAGAVALGMWIFPHPFSGRLGDERLCRLLVLGGALVAAGLADDKLGLSPKVKLLAQTLVALGAYWWCGIGFSSIAMLSWLPPAADAALTVFWIVGAINAFNLIDGLDGLASGLAVIAAAGMAGALFFTGHRADTPVYFAFAGACLGFLRYNFHPASVFLGDSGSMFLGFLLSTLAMGMKAGDSMLVGLGAPLLAMGVPIMDTALAILRRSIRAVLSRGGDVRVMGADTDHLHHRILRKFVSQRKAAMALYGLAGILVAAGFCGLALRSRAAWLFAAGFATAVLIVARDMRRVEFWDAGRLLDTMAHDTSHAGRRRRKMLAVPFYVAADIGLLAAVRLFVAFALGQEVDGAFLRANLPLHVTLVFFSLAAAGTYSTVWSRALVSNYARLAAACFAGTLAAAAAAHFLGIPRANLPAGAALLFALSSLALAGVRMARSVARDAFYALDRGRLAETEGVERVVVYGAGLRSRYFRRELVRSASRNSRVIVGYLDDDALLKGMLVGDMRVAGTLHEAKKVLAELRADAVVVTCRLAPEKLQLAKAVFAEAGVKATVWNFEEKEL